MSDTRWADSGAMRLTGLADGPPLVAPERMVNAIQRLGEAANVDALALLGERAALAGSSRQGTTSCGGGTRLFRTADEFVAVSLTRPDDVVLLPAWVGVDEPPNGLMNDDAWEQLAAVLAGWSARDLVERATMLGLAVSRLGEVTNAEPVLTNSHGHAPALSRLPIVVELASLWAGPLATRLLRAAGARVIKVESLTRPDGARRGNAAFFELMNAGKESVALDLSDERGHEQLRSLLKAADVVVEGSRPRALAQLGIDAHALVVDGPRVWCSITGYGRGELERLRVAFGDDAAVAGGLVADAGDGPCFVADAVADPLTGVVAAAAIRDALQSGERVLLDVALARVAAQVAATAQGARWHPGDDADAKPPSAPIPAGRAPRLGQHTDLVLRELVG